MNVTYKLILSPFIHLRIIMIRRVIWFNWNESNPSSTRSRPGCTWWLQKVCWWFFHSIPYLIINGQAGNAYKLSVQLCQSTFTLTLWCKIWLNQNFVVQLYDCAQISLCGSVGFIFNCYCMICAYYNYTFFITKINTKNIIVSINKFTLCHTKQKHLIEPTKS